VVLDPDGRVLLLRYDDPPPLGTHWLTPGGGIDPGETAREAALRELREETGWSDVLALQELGTSSRPLARFRQHETHFAARVTVPRRPLSEHGHAVDSIAAWGWFPAHSLPPEPVWPIELPSYLTKIFADLPWSGQGQLSEDLRSDEH
jgi:8-oxo-dGTP pyrophosphatase MutT (NUDIX family)